MKFFLFMETSFPPEKKVFGPQRHLLFSDR